MNFNLPKTLVAFSLLALTSCHSPESIVPESWYLLPEQGQATRPGNLTKLTRTVDALFEAQSQALEPFGKIDSAQFAEQSKNHPVDWVPWHLSGATTGLGISAEGLIGALLFEGEAAIQAVWMRTDSETKSLQKVNSNPNSFSALHYEGTPNLIPVEVELEPAIRAALSTGRIKNESRFRKNLIASAEQFKEVATALSEIKVDKEKFKPSAFRLELEFEAEGDLVSGTGLGVEVEMRLDWILKPKHIIPSQTPKQYSDNRFSTPLKKFISAILPDISSATKQVQELKESGFKLTAIKIGLGMSLEGSIGIADASVTTLGVIVFGENHGEGGCYDPDGDGDCHDEDLQEANVSSEKQLSEDLLFITHKSDPNIRSLVNTQDLLSKSNDISILANETKSDALKLNHSRFKKGMKKSLQMASFFAKRAQRVKNGSWKIKELEAEFALSVTGEMGLATIGGEGEIEFEFENEELD